MKVRLTWNFLSPPSCFLKTGVTLAFLQSSDTSSVLHNLSIEWLSNNISLALMGVSHWGLWICGWVPFGPKDLWLSDLSKWPLTWFPSTKGRSSFFQAFSLPSRVWDLQGLALAVKTEAKKAFSNSVFPMSFVARALTSFSRRFSAYLVFILLPMYLRELLLLSLSYPFIPWQHPCISPKWFASFSTFCKLSLPWSHCWAVAAFYSLCASLWVRNQAILTLEEVTLKY